MQSLVRREVVLSARTLVIKIGTNVLARDDDTLDEERLRSLAEQIHQVHETGRRVVVVSSGAVGAGVGMLGLKGRPRDLPHLQAAAAAGQAKLIRLYDDCLRRHGYHAAQLLLTADDFTSRSRYLNIRNTLSTLFEYGAVPVINENDTVSVDEIKFGDNDRLAAMVANLLEDPLLIILTVVDGLYDGDPDQPGSQVIPLVEQWDESLLKFAGGNLSRHGTGGMRTKLEAARNVTAVGESAVIANGTRPNVLADIMAGEDVGTLFLAQGSSVSAFKRWLGYTVPPKGRFVLDAGARRAIAVDGRSLLAIGVTSVEGNFAQGEVVALVDADGREFARGLTNYDATETRAIVGKRTAQIAETLGRLDYEEVIHRDNLVVLTMDDCRME